MNLCKRRGFIFPGSEIYGAIGTAYDFGPLGCQLKKNLMDKWWRDFVERRRDCYGVDTAIIQNPKGQSHFHWKPVASLAVGCASPVARLRNAGLCHLPSYVRDR